MVLISVESHEAQKGRQRLRALVDFYLGVHSAPEIAGQEVNTAAEFARALRETGLDVTEHVGGHGVVGVLANGPGPIVLIRAELDALPLAERTGLSYASGIPGVMHACGHDLHLAAALGSAQELAWSPETWGGTLVVVGQPAEERLTGAEAMLADGLFTRFPTPAVALAQHVAPLPVGVIAHGSALTLASAQVRVDLEGESAHAALAPWSTNMVATIGQVSSLWQEVAARYGALATMTAVTAGSAANVEAQTAELLGSARARSLTVVDDVIDSTRASLASLSSARATLTVTGAAEAVAVDPELAADLLSEHARIFGPTRVWSRYATNAADDFSALGRELRSGKRVRLGYWMFGAVDHDVWRAAGERTGAADAPAIPGNHSDLFAPQLNSIATAVVALTSAARSQLAARTLRPMEGSTS